MSRGTKRHKKRFPAPHTPPPSPPDLAEDVDAHGRDERLVRGFAGREAEGRGVDRHRVERGARRLLRKLDDAPVIVHFHEAVGVVARGRAWGEGPPKRNPGHKPQPSSEP